MSRKNIENIHSLSPMQQGILFHALYDPHPSLYLVEIAWTLRGPLDAPALARAFQEVVDRHTILRTCFAWERLPRPMQIVRRHARLPIEEHDLSTLAPDAQPEAARRIERDFSGRGFDLGRAPLLRVALIRLAEDTHRLLWASHHLILDGWSLPILVREVFTLYEAFTRGEAPELERPRPYGEYLAWIAKQDLVAEEAFWRGELRGFATPTPLSVDRAGGGEGEGFAESTLLLPEAEAAPLAAFARGHQITLGTLIQGAWALLLARYAGEEEVLYGATVSGRSAPVAGIERMVGLFINTLPVRVRVPPDAAALPWLRHLQDKQAELYEHEHSPLVEVQGWSDLPRGAPLFESQVAFENYPSADALLEGGGGLRVVEARMASQAHYPLTFLAVHRRTLGLRIGYDEKRFTRAAVERTLRHVATLLASIAREPSRCVWDLPLLPEEERARVLFAWNESAAPPAEETTVHRLFEDRVAAAPDAIALVAGDDRLTFRELGARARRLARHLRRLGVGPDAVVGLCLGRTAGMIVGILGVLAAGGAYLPLDPAHPPLRLAELREEAGAAVVVTDAAHAHAVTGEGVRLVLLDAHAAAIAAAEDTLPSDGAGPSSLAYVLFTSGSTGTPKGVAVEHRNLVAYLRGVARRLDLPEGARYAHVSTFSADLGHTALFPPLCLGGELHVIAEDLATDPQGLGRYFQREAVDCVKIVPSHLAALLAGASPARVVPRALLVLGGERLTWDLVTRIEALSQSARVLSHYGPTETTVGATTFAVERGHRVPGAPVVPLGRPLPGVRVYVVDTRLAPAPIGVPGEVLIGGAGVARGYLGRPDRTRERFLPDPFVPGGRVYRTGDRARTLDDGTLVFLGRTDDQVKIRGHRVELGEVEAAISACPGVDEAAVLAREDAHGELRLAAYVVPGEGGVDAAELRAFVEARLPAHMVPASFTALERLPLTPNGKVDRRALSARPDGAEAQVAEQELVAPRTPVEEVLAGIWCDVLGRERVSVHDRFADLGGHSLVAIQIIARARDAFQVDVPLRAIFEAPTIAALGELIEEALREAAPPPPPIERAPRDAPRALSFAQERLWFLYQLDPVSPLYNVPSALRIGGRIDVDALERALRDVVRRHEVLRTTFSAADGKPVQVVRDDVDLRLAMTRWSDLGAAGREEAARKEAAVEAHRPFDLAAGPLLRARLLEIGEEDHVLLVTLHHIVSDGSTRAILHRELAALYGAHASGQVPSLPDLPIQYADFAAWQRRWLAGEVMDRQIAYWKRRLEGAPRAIDLPTDRPRPPVPTHRGAQLVRLLPAEVAHGLADLGRREGVTLYMTLLAALGVLLRRWTGQRDLVVGTSATSRSRPETEPLIGFFVNALALRVEVDDDAPFLDLLRGVRAECLGAYAHQDLPFERLVQEIAPDADPSRAPIFQVIFTMQGAPVPPPSLPGLSVRFAQGPSTTVKYDLTFVMGPLSGGGIGVSIEYALDLFDGSSVERMIGHLAALIEGVARDARRAVTEIPMLSDEERRLLLVDWNHTAAAYTTDACVHELFEAQVDRTPEAVAVASGAARLTFREIDAYANRLARILRARGVVPGSVVGLCLPRSVDLVAALLAVLKAGGAYLPLDPAHPPERIAQIARDAGARVVITVDALAPRLPPADLVRLDADEATILRESDARIDGEAASQDLAYVLFTSGSTGRPKGVAVEHRNLVNYVRGLAERLALPAGARWAHVSTFAADLGNTALFPSLCLGGTVHVIPEDLATDPDGLGAYFAGHRIDCLKIVPSHLSALLAGARPERVLPRALLVLGGETSSWDLVERVHRLAPGLRVVNHYGPTETTVGVATFDVDPVLRAEGAPTVPLGRPLPNTQIYVLDPTMRPAPIGVPGELYIGGAGVARGYLGQPELTRDRFVADPFRRMAGARLYRTGDRARTLPDGTLVFLGRVDFQVKVRGHRVELGEIEAVIRAQGGVRDAIVLAQDEAPGDVRLIAYVARMEGTRVDPLELQRRLAERLPAYMVPSSFVAVDALPLGPNGKIDRAALAAIGRAPEVGDAPVAPRTPEEEVLAAVWAEVFGREQVGIHERFADLGGHSLLAVQIIARARAAFGVEIPLRAIFEAPTIAGLAERVIAAVRAREASPPPLVRVPRDRPPPLSFAQERLWLVDQLGPGNPAYNVPMGLRLAGLLDLGALERAIREIVRRHEVLRTTFAAVGGAPVQVVHTNVDLAFPVEALDEGSVEEAARTEAAMPFDLAAGPLLRARLYRLAPDDHVLFVTMHHVVSDAWAKGVFLRELAALYGAFHEGLPSPLPDLVIQYADYATWQRAWLDGEAQGRQIAYWRGALAGAPAALELPADRPRPPVFAARGTRRRFSLSCELRRAIRALARREGATLFMTLLAAFYALLERHGAGDDLVVGAPVAGRSRPEIEPLIGFFVNTLALRARVDHGQSFFTLLASVRESCLGAYAHQDVPFERLVTDLAPARDLSRTPIFQVVFTLEDGAVAPPHLPGISVTPVVAEATTSKFDLTMALRDGPDEILGSLEYNTDLFETATIDRMTARYRTLLEGATRAPDVPLGDLPILPEDERRAVTAWSERAATVPAHACVHEIFEAQVDRDPDAIAAALGEASLSYGELDRRANQLAHHLAKAGVGVETTVGVYATRSREAIVAMLGVLKAGGAYLPLDPDHPGARLSWMAEDGGLRVVVAAGVSAAGTSVDSWAPPFVRVVDMAADAAQIGAERGDRPRRAGSSRGLAYSMYTSGSTGRPKRVGIEHRGVVRLVKGEGDLRFGRDLVLLQHSPLAFDASTLEIWAPLLNGGRVFILAPEAPSVERIGDAIRTGGVTAMWLTAALFNVAVDEDVQALRPLSQLFAGGEALSVPHVQRVLAELPGLALVDGYGPTENTTFTTTHRVLCADGPSIPIGRPIAGTTVYVLDDRLEPAPVGAPGELYAGGDGVARGYLGRPDLTAERFVPDPFGAPGARLYRTGDRARWLADGTLAFLGRVDRQVKIRGFRVELGEIEAVLAQHPATRDAVVIARDDAAGRRLVAYLVLHDRASAPTVDDLRAFAREQLPEAMVPAAFVLLDSLPLTDNGKIDRRALPAPEEADRPELGGAFEPPSTAVEEALARIWAAVLHLPRVGVHDNFFALGGDSILSIQIVSRARQANIALSPRQIFQHQSVAELAAAAGQEQASPMDDGPATGPVPLTPIQRWWLEGDPIDPDHHNQSFLLELRERADPAALEAAIAALLAHHDALRLRLRRGASGWHATIVEPSHPLPFARVDLRSVGDQDLAAAIEAGAATAQASLNLAEGPILRAVLFDPGEGRAERLLLVIHHVAVDGVSWRILLQDLATAYAQAGRREAIVLSPKTLSWRRWAERLVDLARSPALAEEAPRWISEARRLARRVPLDHDRGDDTEASARAVLVRLSAQETAQLLRDVPGAYRTQIDDALLTAFAEATAPWLGSSAVLVDLEGHGREGLLRDADTTRTVGWFTALYPVLLDATGAGTGEALKSVKEQLRAVPRRGGGYGVLRYLREDDPVAEALRALPPADIAFNYLGQLDQAVPEDAPFRRAQEHAGPPRSPRARRRHLLEVNASVIDGQLGVRFAYSENRHRRDTIEALAGRFLRALRELVAHAVSPGAGGYTPSDFPLVRLDQAAIDRLANAAGGRGAIEDVYPLTPLQKGILFHALYAPDPTVYFVQIAWTVRGPLDVPAFVRAWQEVVDRHAALRTGILWEQLDEPVQLVYTRAALSSTERDMRGVRQEEQRAAIERFAEEDRRLGFDLARPPLMRVALLRLGEQAWRFVWSSHHVVLDGWSMPIVLGEALELYDARARGERPRAERARPFGAYVRWLAAQDAGHDASFWRRELAGFSAPTPLPRERVAGAPRFAEARVRLGDDASAALSTFLRRHRLTAGTLVHGAWALLLARYSGEADVLFGSTVSGRSAPVPGIDRMVGLFINTLPLRVHIRYDEPVIAFLSALLEQQAALRDHEASALADVQGLSDVPRGTPLFESLVVFENQPVEQGPAGSARSLAFSDAHAFERPPYPLTLQSSLRGSLLLRVGFDAARFDEPLVDRMLGHLTTLLEGVVRAPSTPVTDLPLLDDDERSRVLFMWNDTAATYAEDACLHELFEAQAGRTPNAVAVASSGRALTYRALDHRSNQLARYLRRRGVATGSRVAICVERSLDMVVGLLGILKAGGAYVPLDPTYPRARLALMAADAGVDAAVAEEALAWTISGARSRLVRMDADREAIDAEEDAPLGRAAGSGSIAYVIYTSGSTGKPKGVEIPHRAVVNFLASMRRAPGLDAHDCLVAVTSLSFDIAGLELWLPLTVGAKVEIAPRDTASDGAALARLLERAGATVMQATPSTWRMLLDAPGGLESRRGVLKALIGGEAVPRDLADALAGQCASVWNMYGPTETTIWSTVQRLVGGERVLIGRPIANTRAYVLDDRLSLAPIGVPGELFIGGDGVARGYLRRPDLTAERFLPDPFHGGPGARMYRTGDLARWLPEGVLECLGRVDAQVKLRGFRIELGEIEATLAEHAGVREAVALVREDAPGERRLAAYVVAADRDAPPSAAALRAHLKERLPDHMVPSAFAPLDALPRTPNGKVDRRALPAVGAFDLVRGVHVEPRGPTEEALARIWRSVLRVDRVGRTDDFFELGGDSIRSIQIVSRAQQAGIRRTVRQVFEHPTIAALAAAADAPSSDSEQRPAVPIPREARGHAPSDFEDAGLSQDALDMLIGMVAGDES